MRLEEVCDLITCGVAKRPEYYNEGIPFLSSKNVKENRFILDHYNYISIEDYNQLTKYNKPQKGDILYTRVGSFGEAAVVNFDFDFAVFVSLTLIKPNRNICDSRFLMYFLNSPDIRKLANESTSGIGVQNLNVSAVRKFPIELPDLPTQQKIAALLDKADELRQYNKQLIEKYDALTQSLFLDMFGDPVKNEKGWEKHKLGDYFNDVKCGPFGSALKKDEFVNGGIPVWNMDNIVDFNFEKKARLHITEEKFNQLLSYSVKSDDIIISRAGTVGKMCVVKTESPSIISTNLIKLSLDSKRILPIYFVLSMKYFASRIGKLKTGSESAFTHMNTGVLKNLVLNVPPIFVQEKFKEQLLLIEQQKELSQQALQKSEELFNSLLQKAFKGELLPEYEV